MAWRLLLKEPGILSEAALVSSSVK